MSGAVRVTGASGRQTPASTAVPTDPLRLWLRLLSSTRSIEMRVASSLRRRFGTTLARFDLLAQLAHARDTHPSGLTMSELSRRLMVSNGNVTGLVARLAREGLIRRRTSARDRRAQLVLLTPKGAATLAGMTPEHRDWVEALFEQLTPDERRTLHGLLGRLKSSVDAADEAGALA